MREENKRIAKNTLIVYVRLIITTFLGLLSSRFVLAALGASDYGLYNVVGATVIMFSFITSALYNTTTRFINYEQGKSDGNVNRIFNMSLAIHICFAIVALLILESIGVYYINNYLNVAAGKESDAIFVFQVSTIVTCLSLISVPYNSLFIVHEDFRTIAIFDILAAIAKFAIQGDTDLQQLQPFRCRSFVVQEPGQQHGYQLLFRNDNQCRLCHLLCCAELHHDLCRQLRHCFSAPNHPERQSWRYGQDSLPGFFHLQNMHFVDVAIAVPHLLRATFPPTSVVRRQHARQHRHIL